MTLTLTHTENIYNQLLLSLINFGLFWLHNIFLCNSFCCRLLVAHKSLISFVFTFLRHFSSHSQLCYKNCLLRNSLPKREKKIQLPSLCFEMIFILATCFELNGPAALRHWTWPPNNTAKKQKTKQQSNRRLSNIRIWFAFCLVFVAFEWTIVVWPRFRAHAKLQIHQFL